MFSLLHSVRARTEALSFAEHHVILSTITVSREAPDLRLTLLGQGDSVGPAHQSLNRLLQLPFHLRQYVSCYQCVVLFH